MRSITTPRLLIFGCATLSALLLGIATASAETTLEKIKRTGVMTSANTVQLPSVRIHRRRQAGRF
jgi:hypothetical protein